MMEKKVFVMVVAVISVLVIAVGIVAMNNTQTTIAAPSNYDPTHNAGGSLDRAVQNVMDRAQTSDKGPKASPPDPATIFSAMIVAGLCGIGWSGFEGYRMSHTKTKA